MPVKLETLWPEENLFDDMEVSLDDLLYSSLHSDDIWKKFELLDLPVDSSPSSVDTESEDPDSQLDSLLEWSLDAAACSTTKEAREIRHHDCMWAGHCGSKEHKPDATKLSANIIVVKQPVQYPNTPNPVVKKPTNGPAATPASNQGRSLLLTSRNVAPAAPVPKQASNGPAQTALPPAAVGNVGPRPDSPPSSDDDDHPRFKHEMAGIFDTPINKTLQFLNDAISECDLDDDSDLCEYFEESDVFVGTDSSGEVSRSYPGESDHSYHKGKGAQHHNHNQHRMDHLGVQTPSDSEEEIDVVSIGEKQSSNTSRCLNTVLPTNPTIRDCQKLQRTVACAINKRDYGQTGRIKTRLPLRIPNSSSPPSERSATMKKRSANDGRGSGGRGVKRARHHRYQKGSPATSPNKRRHPYGQSSDSETECSEKRSLHNNMERQRRVDLRNAFDDLRVLVPEVSCKERAAKVVILREAAAFCDFLSSQSATMAKQVSEMRKQQERLRARVSQLRRSLAAKR